MRGGRVTVAMLLVFLLAVPSRGLAQAPRVPEITKATELIDQGEFEDAVRTLQKGLSTPDLTDDQLVELYRLLGLSQLYLGNEERAREAYEKLLQARPDFDLPKSEPPKIRNLFARIKEDIKKRRVRPVTLTVDAMAEVAGGEPLAIGARIEDLPLGAKAKFFYRRAGQQSYSSVDFSRRKGSREDFTGIVPAFELPEENSAYEIEYYVEVGDAAQRRLAGKGDAFNPDRFKVLPKGQEPGTGRTEAIPVYKSPWFWIGIGVGVAAVTTGVVLLATQKQYGTMTFTVPVQETP
jgi:tetratricopeptide (TPR) repeat protein